MKNPAEAHWIESTIKFRQAVAREFEHLVREGVAVAEIPEVEIRVGRCQGNLRRRAAVRQERREWDSCVVGALEFKIVSRQPLSAQTQGFYVLTPVQGLGKLQVH